MVTEFPDQAAMAIAQRGGEPRQAYVGQQGPNRLVVLYSVEDIKGRKEKHVSVSRSKRGVMRIPRSQDIETAMQYTRLGDVTITESFAKNGIHHVWFTDAETSR